MRSPGFAAEELRLRLGHNGNHGTLFLEGNNAVLEGEKGVVASGADIEACVNLRAALADENRSRLDDLPIVALDAKTARVAVASVGLVC